VFQKNLHFYSLNNSVKLTDCNIFGIQDPVETLHWKLTKPYPIAAYKLCMLTITMTSSVLNWYHNFNNGNFAVYSVNILE